MKKVTATFLSIIFILNTLAVFGSVYAKEDTVYVANNEAYALLYKDVQMTRFNKVEMGDENTPRIINRGGYSVWSFDVDNGTKSLDMFFDLDESFDIIRN